MYNDKLFVAHAIDLLLDWGAITIPEELVPLRAFDYARLERRIRECETILRERASSGVAEGFSNSVSL